MYGYFMGKYREMRIQKVLQATISFAEFIIICTHKYFSKAVRYIHDNRSWEKCYILIIVIFPCLRVLRLADSNISGMEKVYYYLKMTKQCIEKLIYDIEYQKLFSDVFPPANIWSKSDDKSDTNSQYQMSVQSVQTILVLSDQYVEWKWEPYQY